MAISLGLLESAGVAAVGAFLTSVGAGLGLSQSAITAAGAAGAILAYGGISAHLAPTPAASQPGSGT